MVAVKALSLQSMSDWKQLDLFQREANTLKELKHPGIPQYVADFEEDTEKDRGYFLVQVGFCMLCCNTTANLTIRASSQTCRSQNTACSPCLFACCRANVTSSPCLTALHSVTRVNHTRLVPLTKCCCYLCELLLASGQTLLPPVIHMPAILLTVDFYILLKQSLYSVRAPTLLPSSGLFHSLHCMWIAKNIQAAVCISAEVLLAVALLSDCILIQHPEHKSVYPMYSPTRHDKPALTLYTLAHGNLAWHGLQ